jgi:hypothetical protein
MADFIDDQGRLHIEIKPSLLACGECGQPGPNKEWTLMGDSGVLCARCLSRLVQEINESLGATSMPTENYEPQSGDISLHYLRPGQWNVHQYMNGIWEYQTMLPQAEAEKFVVLMRLVGETNDASGKRRYYRQIQA